MIEADDALLARLSGEGGDLPGIAPLRVPPSGLLDTREECSGDMAFVRRVVAGVREKIDPCAWVFVKETEVISLYFFTEPLNEAGEAILSGSLAPDYQNRGHGVRLYRRFIKHVAKTSPATALRVQVFKSNRRSSRVHEFLGFQVIEEGDDAELGPYAWYRLDLRDPARQDGS